MKKNQRGITLIALGITLAIMVVLIGIVVSTVVTIIETGKLQELSTNMLLIQAKAKTIAEKYNFDETSVTLVGTINTDNINTLKTVGSVTNTQNISLMYTLSETDISDFGLTNLKLKSGEAFVVDYSSLDVEVYYIPGFEHNGTTYYELSKIMEISVNE